MYAEPLFVLIAFVSSWIGVGASSHDHKASAAALARLQSATDIVGALPRRSKTGSPLAQAAQADCVAVIPTFADNVSTRIAQGQGFMSCREGHQWSAPRAIVLESPHTALLADGRQADVVLLLNRGSGESLLSASGGVEDVSGGKLFYRQSKHVFAEFALSNAVLRQDTAANEYLYGEKVKPSEILNSFHTPPRDAQDFVSWVDWRFR